MGLATDFQSKSPLYLRVAIGATVIAFQWLCFESVLTAQTYARFGDKQEVAVAPATPVAEARLVADPSVQPASFQQTEPALRGPRNATGSLPTRVGQLSRQPTPALVNQIRNSYSKARPDRVARALVPPPRSRRQEDPFGENQPMPEPQPRAVPSNTVTPRGNSFEVFPSRAPVSESPRVRQEDPFGENQKPPVNPNVNPQQPPVGDPTRPPGSLPGENPPTQVPNTQGGNVGQPDPINPTNPTTNPRVTPGVDPVLPSDANPGTPTTQIPGLQNPNPGNPSQPYVRPREDYPEGAVRPGQVPPMQLNGYPQPRLDESMDYDSSRPLQEVQSGRAQTSNQYRPPQAVEPQNGTGEYFVPAFDPIPGLPMAEPLSAPGLTQPDGMAQPYEYPPHQYGQPMVRPSAPIVSNPPPAQGQVYSPVVAGHAQAGCQGCLTQGCRGCDPCDPCHVDTGLSMRRGVLRSLVADDCVSQNQSVCPEFYFGFQGGWSDLQNMLSDNDNELETEAGSAFAFSLGRINGGNLRTEIELAFRNNDISDLLFRGESQGYAGDVSTFSGMANAYWEFVDFPGGRFRPYIGGGVGFASHDLAIDGTTGGITFPTSGESTSFAYQWMAGLNYRASRNLDIFVEYRFFEADSVTVQSPTVFSDPSMMGSLGGGDYNFQVNNVGIGLRWKF